MDGLSAEQAEKFVGMLETMGHESPVEHVTFTFGIAGVSRSLLAQITRHRIASFSVQSQRYVRKNHFTYVTPPAIAADETAAALYHQTMEQTVQAYNALADRLQATYYPQFLAEGCTEKAARSKAEKKAIEDGVPIIRSETAALLRSLTAALRPENILEIGTAVGYSALQMCQVMPANCHITTIEKYEKRIPEAKENFRKAGEESRITFLEGDADMWLKELKGKQFDLVFMDAAKGQYLNWLPLLLDLMPVGAVLISDNVLQDGDVVQSRFAVQRRNRTIHSRMREYLYELKHMEEFETAVIPIGDGVTISTRIR